MDPYNVNNNREQQQQQQHDYEQPPHEPTAASLIATPTAGQQQQQQAFSYSLPMHDADEEDSESNKSTPYYTPLEFSQSSFEFPSPKPKHAPADLTTTTTTTASAKDQLTSVAEYAAKKLPTVPPSPSSSAGSPAITVVAATPACKAKPPTPGGAGGSTGPSALHSPPVINRKLRRFSLYERRSCSPQHLLVKNSSLGSGQDSPGGPASHDPHHLHDKENTKPLHGDEPQLLHPTSGNNSPIALLEDGSAATLSSPKILGAANEANMFGGGGRLAYSPKLLASINNLNLSGSPLSVLSSAGYKNGNYFKFPEIDHVVQVASAEAEASEDAHPPQDNQNRCSRRRGLERGGNSSPDTLWGSRGNASGSMPRPGGDSSATATAPGHGSDPGRPLISKSNAISVTDTRKNRKNKNNLTIRITDIAPQAASTCSAASLVGGSVATAAATTGISPSPSPSPKPKTPTIKSTKEKALSLDSAATGDHELKIIVSCRQDHGSCLDIDGSKASEGPSIGLDTVSLKIPDSAGAHLSSSLNQLSSEAAAGALLCGSTLPNKPSFGLAGQRLGESFMRTSRRRISGSASGHSDWYQRQQNSFLSKSLNVDPCGEGRDEAERPTIFTKVMQTSNSGSLGPSPVPGATASTPVGGQRGPFKLNPLLHSSNTNLKTLPEFLTLVEFSNPKEPAGPGESPYKQKSMDLPSSSLAGLRVAKPQVTTSSSSTNLLQRRGSNHSLTLNLHGSCGNLLGNCRSGLSVSNYSLGSVAANSTTNLNSKSSGNLECGSSATAHPPTATTTTQVVVDAASVAAAGETVLAGSSAQVTKQTLFRRRGSNHSLTLTNLAATSCGSLNSFASQNSLNVDRLHLHPHGDGSGVAMGGVTRTTSFITPSKLSGAAGGTKRGLLERRGSNQSLTLNMGGSFGGIGTERSHQHAVAASSTSNYYLHEAMGCGRATGAGAMAEADTDPEADTGLSLHPPTGCAQHRKFFSSESLNRNNTQFSDLNQAHKRNANQVCFGSVSDLKPSGEFGGGPGGGGSREHFDFQESTMCTCSGVRNIGTRPLSPQTTSEEFKIYLANIQMLQNASNALNQLDLIKLNYIFDNSYLATGKGMASQPLPVLSVHESREAETPPGLMATSEDHEVAARFQEAVGEALQRVQPGEEETKRMFCDLHKEFWDLPLNHQEKPMVFGSQAKNRYKTILPNENSRVLLEKESSIWADLLANYDCLRDEMAEPLTPRQAAMAEEVPYINANYIKGPDYNSKCYVATQGPLPNTIFEFWLMVYLNTQKHLQNAKKLSSPITKNGRTLQQYYQKIVMLTNFLENNRQKCATYFPVELNEIFVVTPKHEVLPANEPLNELLNEYLQLEDEASPQPGETPSEPGVSIEFLKTSLSGEQSALMPEHTNFFAVKNVGIVRKNGFSIRKLIALYCVRIPAKGAGEPQQFLVQKFRCYHYWYPDWPDHRSPRDINTLLDICLHVLNLGKCEAEFDAFAEDCSPGPGSPAPHIKAQEVALYQQDIFNSVQPLPIIHCSAGIGRTGCFTAILNGIRQLRQSLAYSLTSMASAASRRDGNGHVLSPVDFCLPADFVKDQQPDEIDRILSNDTDSSFTRNTMLHMKYILERHGDAAVAGGEWQLPSLRELPKMPDVFVDILGIVCNLRLQRGGMVQNSEQYELIHRAICLYMKRAFALKRF